MQQDGCCARLRRLSALLVPAALALVASAARAQIPDGLTVSIACGGTITPSSVKIEAGLGTGCEAGSQITITALQAGTFTFDLNWGSTPWLGEADFQVTVQEPDEQKWSTLYSGWFSLTGGSFSVTGISVELHPGTILSVDLDTFYGSPGKFWVSLDNITFEPQTGFFDEGDDLDGSAIRIAKSGQPLVMLGDVDGDGGADYAFNDSAAQYSPTPLVRVVSGVSGAVITEFDGKKAVGGDAWLADVGDVDGDGLDDIAVGDPLVVTAGKVGRVRVRSAATGAILLEELAPHPTSDFGRSVGGPGDVNLDGVPDLLVGAPEDDTYGKNEGIAWLFSGADGATLLSLGPPDPAVTVDYGRYVLGAGDVDADGRPDLVVRHGASYDVHVRSGADGALLLVLNASESFPHCVAAGPDLDLDGHADIILGRPYDGGGSVHAFSGADGHRLWTSSYDPKKWWLGAALAALDDENGDGIVDVLVGLPYKDFGIGRAELLSGADGSVIYDAPAPADWDGTAQYGLDLYAGQDVDGDGAADAVVLAPGTNMLVVLSGSFANNVAPVLAGVGDLAPGSPTTVSITQGLPGGEATLLVGFVELFLPFKGGFLQAKPDLILPLVLGPHGAVSFDAQVPADMPSAFTFWMQSWHPDPGGPQGYKASNVLRCLTK